MGALRRPRDVMARRGIVAAAAGVAASIIIAVGNAGVIRKSTDGGLTWASKTSGTSEHLLSVCHGAGIWIIVGANDTILRSTDGGETWAAQTSPLSGFRGNCVRYVNGWFVAGGRVGTSVRIIRSTNGSSWSSSSVSGTSTVLSGISYAFGRYVCAGSGADIIYSTNLTSWSPATVSGVSNDFDSLIFGNGYMVAPAGSFGTGARSTNGTTFSAWTRPSSTNMLMTCFDGTQFVQVGTTKLWTATTPTSWTEASITGPTYGTGLIFKDTLYVIVGDNGYIATSPTASVWTSRTSGTTEFLWDVASN